MLDNDSLNQVTNVVNSILSSYGIGPKEKKQAPKKDTSKRIPTRKITEENVPECLKAYTLLLNEALAAIDYFWLSEDCSGWGVAGNFHGCVSLNKQGMTAVTDFGEKITLNNLTDWLFMADLVDDSMSFSKTQYLGFTGKHVVSMSEAALYNKLIHEDKLPMYRIHRILTDAVAAGCFPADIKLIQGVGFVLAPCYRVTPEEYHAYRNSRMS